ncbi:MAG: hypothetical protein ACJAVI_003312 [Candidatus Azotimanducaceae bacterium]|jgi:hypothetical protein
MIFQKREIGPLNEVRFKGPGNLTIAQAETQSLIIHGPESYLSQIRSEVVDGVLYLGYYASTVFSLAFLRQQISYELKVKDLQKINSTGSGNIDVPDLDVDYLRVKMSGSGNVSMGNLTADKLDMQMSGSGRAIIAGDVELQSLDLSGSGRYQAEGLVSDFAIVKLMGSGGVEITVSDDLQVQISGSGCVTYEGYPDVTRNISGSGKLNRKRRQIKANSRSEEHG